MFMYVCTEYIRLKQAICHTFVKYIVYHLSKIIHKNRTIVKLLSTTSGYQKCKKVFSLLVSLLY